jgi:para-nitrobenzyl esterase
MWWRRALIIVCLALVVASCSNGHDDGSRAKATPAGDPLRVTTSLGQVRGTHSAVNGVRAFLSMPYAAPPTGANRWRPPQPRARYRGVLDATRPGHACPQNTGDSTARFTKIPSATEDCLNLDVWSPTGAKDLPVMFWIHGGGLRAGSAHQVYYQGDDLASEGVVVVSANYRLGAFGFLATNELASESRDGSFGNYGLADQVAALEWVRRNGKAFGGDPRNVTILGESAGGASVCAHLASPGSDRLFRRAIVESGGGCGQLQEPTAAKAAGAKFLQTVGCADMACLRKVPTDKILATDFDASFVADGVRMTDTGRTRAQRGDLRGKQVIIGSNANEALLFTIGMQTPTDAALADLASELTNRPQDLLALYPAAGYPDNLARYRTMLTDARFTCPTLAFAQAARNDTYVYNFVYTSPDERFAVATHGVELAFLFAHPEGIVGQEPGLHGADAEVSDAMQVAWTQFARTGHPGPDWRPYATARKATVIDNPVTLANQIRDGRCDTVNELSTLRR